VIENSSECKLMVYPDLAGELLVLLQIRREDHDQPGSKIVCGSADKLTVTCFPHLKSPG
jgi:hypothetical protein